MIKGEGLGFFVHELEQAVRSFLSHYVKPDSGTRDAYVSVCWPHIAFLMSGGMYQFAGCLICLSFLAGCGSGESDVSQPVSDDQPKIIIGNNGPEGDSGLSVGNLRYPLDSALGDIWGATGGHFQIDFTFTNGNFTLDTIVRDGQSHRVLVPALASAVFRAEMFSVGNQFDYGSYAFVSADDTNSISSGVGYFTRAYVGVDVDQNGRVSESEKINVVAGSIEFAGAVPDISLNFSVTLDDGQYVTGHYSGLFDFTRR
ncbi:MAG: hypothetical protein AB8B97_09325 [Granulosicoccus sp.]